MFEPTEDWPVVVPQKKSQKEEFPAEVAKELLIEAGKRTRMILLHHRILSLEKEIDSLRTENEALKQICKRESKADLKRVLAELEFSEGSG